MLLCVHWFRWTERRSNCETSETDTGPVYRPGRFCCSFHAWLHWVFSGLCPFPWTGESLLTALLEFFLGLTLCVFSYASVSVHFRWKIPSFFYCPLVDPNHPLLPLNTRHTSPFRLLVTRLHKTRFIRLDLYKSNPKLKLLQENNLLLNN